MNRISTSENTMNKQTKATNDKPTPPKTSNKRRRLGVADLLCAASSLSAAVLVGALAYTKRPPLQGD